MRLSFSFLLVLTILASCKEQDPFVESRLKTTDKFIDCLKNNTPDKILDFTYPDVDEKINNKKSREFNVNKAYKFINKFGLPPKSKWTINYDPKNNFERLMITIPIFKGHDTALNLLQADIIIKFPPPQISEKIYSYEVVSRYEIDQTVPVTSAPSLDTISSKIK